LGQSACINTPRHLDELGLFFFRFVATSIARGLSDVGDNPGGQLNIFCVPL